MLVSLAMLMVTEIAGSANRIMWVIVVLATIVSLALRKKWLVRALSVAVIAMASYYCIFRVVYAMTRGLPVQSPYADRALNEAFVRGGYEAASSVSPWLKVLVSAGVGLAILALVPLCRTQNNKPKDDKQ